ncbi:MAG: hypothetical protein ACPKPY_05315 [Nitrososphaeraceae archaeon]
MINLLSKLENGDYPCSAILKIRDGKATVVLGDGFGLKDGTEIPLKNQPKDSRIKIGYGDSINLFNGHAIV